MPRYSQEALLAIVFGVLSTVCTLLTILLAVQGRVSYLRWGTPHFDAESQTFVGQNTAISLTSTSSSTMVLDRASHKHDLELDMHASRACSPQVVANSDQRMDTVRGIGTQHDNASLPHIGSVETLSTVPDNGSADGHASAINDSAGQAIDAGDLSNIQGLVIDDLKDFH